MVGVEVEQAMDLLLQEAAAIQTVEMVSLLDALQRVCAEDILAPMDNPPFDRSPLDGYTFQAADTDKILQGQAATFKIIGEVCAGQTFSGKVESGQAVNIMTGGKMPAGCDCVVRQENVTVENGILSVSTHMSRHENYCFKGEDIKKNSCLIKKGTVLCAAHLGTLASMGYAQIKVYKKMKVALCSTGDELVDVGGTLPEGKIYNSNLYILSARLRELGLEPLILGIADDDEAAVAALIEEHSKAVDLFLTTGGVSVGKKDIMHAVIQKLQARRLFWRVSMKPGTPILSYVHNDTLCIALSGNPFAALATFELLVRPVLAKISRNSNMQYKRQKAVLQDDFIKESQGRRFIRAHYKDGEVRLPAKNHSSGSLFSAVGCNAMIDIPGGTPYLKTGMPVDVIIL